MKGRSCARWLLALSVLAPAAYGEPVYVIEQLVVGVTSDPGSDGERIGQVKSGDRLELLEREGDEAHVRLPNGQEGWLKSSYVSAEEPLQARLTARAAELEKLKQEDERLKQDVGRLQSELAAARTAHAPASSPSSAAGAGPVAPASSRPAAQTGTPPAADPGTRPTADPGTPPAADSGTAPAPIRETVFLRSPDKAGQTSWSFVLGIGFVMLLVGFVLGWKTLDRRIRQKYGGLRIY